MTHLRPVVDSMTRGDVVAEWATWMRAGGIMASSIDMRCWHVRKVLRELRRPATEVSTDDLVRYFAAQTWKPNTRRAYRASLTAFFTWLRDRGDVDHNPAALVPRVRLPRALPRPTPEEAYRDAVLAAQPRERLMLMLGGVCALRRAEIAKVRREDLVAGDGHALRVIGKGGHERLVPLPPVMASMILACPPGWLFPSPARVGPLTPAHVGKLVSRALPDGWTCHTLRHRSATVGLWATGDIRAVQELLGQARLDTTQIYTKVRAGALRQVIDATAA